MGFDSMFTERTRKSNNEYLRSDNAYLRLIQGTSRNISADEKILKKNDNDLWRGYARIVVEDTKKEFDIFEEFAEKHNIHIDRDFQFSITKKAEVKRLEKRFGKAIVNEFFV